jgi:hypothetical protein
VHYQFIINFGKKYLKKVQKNNFEKMSIFVFFGKNRLWTFQVGGSILWRMVILLATYLKIGLDYEYDIKTAKFNYNLLKTCGSYKNPLFSGKYNY